MNKRERVQCAMSGGKPDKVPVSIYQHSTVHDRGVFEFTNYSLRYHQKYDPDYVKVMYDEMYDAPVNFQFVSDPGVWNLLEVQNVHQGALGRCVESLKRIRDAVPYDTPVLGTVFSPFHVAVRLAWTRVLSDCKTDPAAFQKGLSVITQNLCAFVRAAANEAGIDGMLVGAYGAEHDWLSEKDYVAIAAPHDLALMEALKAMPFVIVHAHGEKGSYFDHFAAYPCAALSWEDRLAGPSLAEARKRTKKCLVGGVDHIAARTASKEQVYAQAKDAIAQMKGTGFILAPGCTFEAGTPPENMLILKKAAEDAAKEGI